MTQGVRVCVCVYVCHYCLITAKWEQLYYQTAGTDRQAENTHAARFSWSAKVILFHSGDPESKWMELQKEFKKKRRDRVRGKETKV